MDCIIWTGSRVGEYGIGAYGRYVHRIAWEAANGPIPEGMCVLHKCDNTLCINPDHLFIGTLGDNNRDRHAKKRDARGESHGMSKLTESDVRMIRKSTATNAELCRQLKVDARTISLVRRGETWRHVV